jgi:hypothetical protein
MERTLRALLARPRKRWTIAELAREAEAGRSRVSREVRELARSGHLHPKSLILLRPRDTLTFFATGWYAGAVPALGFAAVERAEEWIAKIAAIANERRLRVAFTGLAGAELLAPVVVPSTVHAYVPRPEVPKWAGEIESAGAYPAEDARSARVLLLSWDHADYRAIEVRGTRVVSVPQMYADLRSSGGIEVQAADRVLEAWDVRPA